MSKNYDMKRVGKENYHDSKYSFKALQLTPTSNKNIVGNYDKGIKALDEAKRKENLQAVFSKPVEKSAPVKDENISLSDNSVEINILLEKNIINTKKEVIVTGKKPIRLIPKMYAPISKAYNDEFLKSVKNDVEKEVVEDIQPPVIENDVKDDDEIELKAPEVQNKVELDYEKISAALEEVAKNRFDNDKEDVVEEVKSDDKKEEIREEEEKTDRKEQIERFLELKRLIKQQKEDREKAEKANHDLAKDEEDASRKYSETFDRFVELNNNLEKEASKNSELISEMLKSNEKLSESIAKINRESDELRAMLDNGYEDSETHKKVA